MVRILKIINDWQLRGFLFDFDGTLIDTVDAYLQTYIELFREEFGLEFSPSQIIIHFGKPAYKIIREATGLKLTEEEISRLIKRREEILLSRHLDKVKLVDGVNEILDVLRSNDMKLAIVTSSTRSMLTAIARKYNLLKWFDVTITADDVKKGKPDPEPFLKAMELLKLQHNSVVAVGDTIYDILSAKRGHIKIIFLKRDRNIDLSEVEEKPDIIIESFRELLL